MFQDTTISSFLEVLSDKTPVPGGGGAAALSSAIGAALGSMVASLTIGKKTYAAVEEEMIALKDKALQIESELLTLMEEDARCFEPLAAAYKLPADTEEDKAIKEETLEQCAKAACRPPYEIMCKTCEAIELTEQFARKGSKLAVSDAGCAAATLKGALFSAALNIFINTKSLKDREYAREMNHKADEMLAEYGGRADVVYVYVKNKLI